MLIHYNRVLREGVLSSERLPDRVLNQDFFLIQLETFFVSSQVLSVVEAIAYFPKLTFLSFLNKLLPVVEAIVKRQ